MSATATATPVPPAPPAPERVGFLSVLQAELGRSRRTFTWRSALVTVLLAAWAINLSRSLMRAGLITDAGRWAGNILAWLSVYPDALALPVGALVGAMYEWREQRVRGGGTLWRATGPVPVLAARCLVIAASALLSQLGWLVPVLVFAQVSGAGWGPWGSYLTFAALMWVSTTGAGLLGLAATRLTGPLAVGVVPVLAMAWTTAGAFQAELSSWYLRPWTWVRRPTLPLLGVHANGLNLEPDAAAWAYPVWPGLVLSTVSTLVLAAVVLATAPLVQPRLSPGLRRVQTAPDETTGRTQAVSTGPTMTAEPLAAGPGRRSTLLALAGVLPWRLWAVLWLPLAGLVAVARVWYSSDVAVALLTLAGLPVASTIVGITTWTALRSAWRGVLMRVPGWRAASAALLSGWCFLMVALGAAWVVATSGTRLFLSEPDRSALAGPVYAALVIPWVAAALAALSYLLAQSTSVATAIAVGTGGLLAGLVIAGNDVIAQGPLTWMTAPWGWAYIASTYPGRWLMVVGLGALMTLASTVLAALLARRAARVAD